MAGKSINVSETPFFDHKSHLEQPVLGGSRTCCEIGSQEWNLLVRHLFCSLLTPDLLASKRCGFEALIMSVRTGVTGVLSDGCKACIVGPARTWIIHENPCAGLVNTCYPLLPAYIGRWTWFFWWTGQGLHFCQPPNEKMTISELCDEFFSRSPNSV